MIECWLRCLLGNLTGILDYSFFTTSKRAHYLKCAFAKKCVKKVRCFVPSILCLLIYSANTSLHGLLPVWHSRFLASRWRSETSVDVTVSVYSVRLASASGSLVGTWQDLVRLRGGGVGKGPGGVFVCSGGSGSAFRLGGVGLDLGGSGGVSGSTFGVSVGFGADAGAAGFVGLRGVGLQWLHPTNGSGKHFVMAGYFAIRSSLDFCVVACTSADQSPLDHLVVWLAVTFSLHTRCHCVADRGLRHSVLAGFCKHADKLSAPFFTASSVHHSRRLAIPGGCART